MKTTIKVIGLTIAAVWFAILTSLCGMVLFGSITGVLCTFFAALAGHENVLYTAWQGAILGAAAGAVLAHLLPFFTDPPLKLEDKPAPKAH